MRCKWVCCFYMIPGFCNCSTSVVLQLFLDADKYVLCIPAGHYEIKNLVACIVLCSSASKLPFLLVYLVALNPQPLGLILFRWFLFTGAWVCCLHVYAAHIWLSPWFVACLQCSHIMGAVVVLSVTRWYAQQLFVFLGGSLQKFHLWQLALSTKAR
jgi:hypothetical protein